MRIKKNIEIIISSIILVLVIMFAVLFYISIRRNLSNGQTEELLNDLAEFETKTCNEIRNPHLKFVCIRMTTGRPHMNLFVTKNTSFINVKLHKLPSKCDQHSVYYALYCMYALAAETSKDNLNHSLRICGLINNTEKSDECKFYVQTSYVSSISENAQTKIDFLMSYCSEFSDPNWKSECYFLLADELTLLDSEKYLDKINTACKASYNARDYFCFHHVVFNMAPETAKNFCDLIENEHKNRCFMAYGHSIGTISVFQQTNVTEKCNSLQEEYKGDCYMGLGHSFALYPDKDVQLGIERCKQLEQKQINNCMNGLSIQTGLMTLGNISEGISWCSLMPDEKFTKRCYRGLGISKYLAESGEEKILNHTESIIPPEYFTEFIKGYNEKAIISSDN